MSFQLSYSGAIAKTGYYTMPPTETERHYSLLSSTDGRLRSETTVETTVNQLRETFLDRTLREDSTVVSFLGWVCTLSAVEPQGRQDGEVLRTYNDYEMVVDPGRHVAFGEFHLTVYDLVEYASYVLTNTSLQEIDTPDPRVVWIDELRNHGVR